MLQVVTHKHMAEGLFFFFLMVVALAGLLALVVIYFLLRAQSRWARRSGGVLLLSFCLLCAHYLYAGMRNYMGYCAATGVRQSDDERIRRAIEHFLIAYPKDEQSLSRYFQMDSDASGTAHRIKGTPIPYINAAQFRELNPDCCSVTPTPAELEHPPSAWLDRVFGATSSFVNIRYRLRYHDQEGVAKDEVKHTTSAISNCGHVWRGY